MIFDEIQINLQINRLEETWTVLRRNYTETAISYEKTLKPFYKNLYEGTGTDRDYIVYVPISLTTCSKCIFNVRTLSSCSFLSSDGLRPPPASPPDPHGASLHHTRRRGALGDQRPGLRHHAAPPRGRARRGSQLARLHGQRGEDLAR